jgi:sec-independent protein translocase protein TatA
MVLNSTVVLDQHFAVGSVFRASVTPSAVLIVLLVIIPLFLGAKRVPELARSLGTGARELKKAASEDNDENETKTDSEKKSDEHRTQAAPEDARSEHKDAQAEQEPRGQ